jgi:hypothetical protein
MIKVRLFALRMGQDTQNYQHGLNSNSLLCLKAKPEITKPVATNKAFYR